MTVYKRAGSDHWQIEFIFKGRRIRRSSGTSSKRRAEEFERQLRRHLHDSIILNRPIEPTSVTLREALSRFHDASRPLRRTEAARKRAKYFQTVLERAFGPETRLEQLTAERIGAFKEALLSEGKKPATVNRYLAVLRSVLTKACEEWNALAAVPTIKLFRLNNHRVRWLTAEEEECLLQASANHLQPLLVFLIDTGARLSEATGLQWSEVDLDPNTAGVRFERTKTGRPRRVPLSQRVRKVLMGLHERQDHPQTGAVFRYGVGDAARPFYRPYVAWNTAVSRAGLSDIRIHDLRHTFASRLVMRGVPLITVSHLLGHTSIEMTMRYAHLAPTIMPLVVV